MVVLKENLNLKDMFFTLPERHFNSFKESSERN
jgi:hypothetical protein